MVFYLQGPVQHPQDNMILFQILDTRLLIRDITEEDGRDIHWYCRAIDSPVQPSDNMLFQILDTRLLIRDITEEDGGEIHCIAINPAGEYISTAHLEVRGK